MIDLLVFVEFKIDHKAFQWKHHPSEYSPRAESELCGVTANSTFPLLLFHIKSFAQVNHMETFIVLLLSH